MSESASPHNSACSSEAQSSPDQSTSFWDRTKSEFSDLKTGIRDSYLIASRHPAAGGPGADEWSWPGRLYAGAILAAGAYTAYSACGSSYLPSVVTDAITSAASGLGGYIPTYLSNTLGSLSSYVPCSFQTGAAASVGLIVGLGAGRMAYCLSDFKRGVVFNGDDEDTECVAPSIQRFLDASGEE